MGMVVAEEQPLPDINALIQDLTAAGIRFVYFSPENDQQAKHVGVKLGLEIEWNSHISLVRREKQKRREKEREEKRKEKEKKKRRKEKEKKKRKSKKTDPC